MYSYEHRVLPEAKSWDFLPSNAMLVQVAELLQAQGWVESKGTVRARETDPLTEEPALFSETDYAGLARIAMKRPESYGFRAAFPRRPDSWWEAKKSWRGVKPEHTSSLSLDLPRLLAVLPSQEVHDVRGLFVPCPDCGADLTLPVGQAWSARASEDFWEGVGLPRACSSCQAPTHPGKLSGYEGGPKGAGVRSPFYRFALEIGLSLDTPPRKLPAATPSALMDGLREICGVRFRAHGKVL
jgi:hypothetical protein